MSGLAVGMVTLLHDESWRAARLVVKHFESRLTDVELVEAVHAVREIIASSLEQFQERWERERKRIGLPDGHAR